MYVRVVFEQTGFDGKTFFFFIQLTKQSTWRGLKQLGVHLPGGGTRSFRFGRQQCSVPSAGQKQRFYDLDQRYRCHRTTVVVVVGVAVVYRRARLITMTVVNARQRSPSDHCEALNRCAMFPMRNFRSGRPPHSTDLRAGPGGETTARRRPRVVSRTRFYRRVFHRIVTQRNNIGTCPL